jgi:hypothetical protein
MPIDQNSFNSRVTSEALEQKFRDNFPAQGGAELIQDLYASGVIVPIVDFTPTATGDVLPQNLQTAFDFSTGNNVVNNATTNLITTPGFWELVMSVDFTSTTAGQIRLLINDGASTKTVMDMAGASNRSSHDLSVVKVVFLRAGDTLQGVSSNTSSNLRISYRQIADVNGNVVNPLGFSF